MSTYIIYETLCLENLKIYIGQHYTSADDGYLGSGKVFQKALKKYGKEKFQRTTIEFCTSADVNERETYWINQLSATNPNIGYNICTFGNGNFRQGTNPWNKGKVGIYKKETLEKLRIAGKSEINRKNHLGNKNGKYKNIDEDVIKKFINFYNQGFSIYYICTKLKIGRKKAYNLSKEISDKLLSQKEIEYKEKEWLKSEIKIFGNKRGLISYLSKKYNKCRKYFRDLLKSYNLYN